MRYGFWGSWSSFRRSWGAPGGVDRHATPLNGGSRRDPIARRLPSPYREMTRYCALRSHVLRSADGRNSGGALQDAGAYAARMTKVLVVDDDSTVAEVVVAYLERAGFDTRHVGDGAE